METRRQGQTKTTSAQSPVLGTAIETEPDGRRRRSQKTRLAIVNAYIDLIRQEASTTADDVARQAGVSTRSIFDRFPTVGDVAVAAFDHIISTQLAIIDAGAAEASLDVRISEFVKNRATNCEALLPVRAALVSSMSNLAAVRKKVAVMRDQRCRRLQSLFQRELSLMPAHVRTATALAIEALTELEIWDRMRKRDGMSFEQGMVTWRTALECLLGSKR